MIKNSFLLFLILLLTLPAFGTITTYKHWNDGLGVWDYTLTTSSLWTDWVGEGASYDHLVTGKDDFPAGNSSFRGCAEFTPGTKAIALYHHDYDDVIWNDNEGTMECWIAPHWDGENQGGPTYPPGTMFDVIIGDGIAEIPCTQGFNVLFFENGVSPGPQLLVCFTDNSGAVVYENYDVGKTVDWVAGGWHHICVSWDSSEVMAGLDGVIFGKKARNGGFNFAKGGYLFGMGRSGGPINGWDGWADDFAVHDTALYTGAGDVNDPYPGPAWPTVPVNDKKAWAPTPTSGTTVDKVAGSTLSWQPGTNVITHLVYWSNVFEDVNSRNFTPITLTHAVDGNSVATPNTPQIGETYYWAVDEVDSIPSTTIGDPWQYTIIPWIIVDDMENYDGSSGSGNDVSDTWTSTAGANIHVIDDGYEGTKQAMEFIYDNNGPGPYYSEIVVDTSLLECGSDWITDGTRWLQVNFKGDPNNDPNERMYLAIEDGNSPDPNFAMVQYGLPDQYSLPDFWEDMNDIRLTSWDGWGWAINLQSFTGVDLTDVRKVYIGFGQRGKINDGSRNGAEPGQYQGVMVMDEIRLRVPFPVPPWPQWPPEADLNGDWEVNFKDLALLANDWLFKGRLYWPDW